MLNLSKFSFSLSSLNCSWSVPSVIFSFPCSCDVSSKMYFFRSSWIPVCGFFIRTLGRLVFTKLAITQLLHLWKSYFNRHHHLRSKTSTGREIQQTAAGDTYSALNKVTSSVRCHLWTWVIVLLGGQLNHWTSGRAFHRLSILDFEGYVSKSHLARFGFSLFIYEQSSLHWHYFACLVLSLKLR